MLLLQAMKRKTLFCALAASALICVLSFGAAEAADNPALAIMKLYWNDIEDHDVINPYTVSILAMNEIEEGRNIGMVKQFIVWYFDSINEGDKDGLTGTIYDFRVAKDGGIQPTGDYDSVDGYAGAFLHLLKMYYEKTRRQGPPDRKLGQDRKYRIPDCASAGCRRSDSCLCKTAGQVPDGQFGILRGRLGFYFADRGGRKRRQEIL